jgi:hypothetical protein
VIVACSSPLPTFRQASLTAGCGVNSGHEMDGDIIGLVQGVCYHKSQRSNSVNGLSVWVSYYHNLPFKGCVAPEPPGLEPGDTTAGSCAGQAVPGAQLDGGQLGLHRLLGTLVARSDCGW